MATKKNEAAVALGRLGGAKKVPKGTALMTDEKRREVAMAGVAARAAKAKKAAKNAAKGAKAAKKAGGTKNG